MAVSNVITTFLTADTVSADIVTAVMVMAVKLQCDRSITNTNDGGAAVYNVDGL